MTSAEPSSFITPATATILTDNTNTDNGNSDINNNVTRVPSPPLPPPPPPESDYSNSSVNPHLGEHKEMCPSFAILHGVFESDINEKTQRVEVVADNCYAYTPFPQRLPLEEAVRREVLLLSGAPYKPYFLFNSDDDTYGNPLGSSPAIVPLSTTTKTLGGTTTRSTPSAGVSGCRQQAQQRTCRLRREGMVTWSSRETEEVNDLLRGLKWRVYIGSLGTDCRAWAAEVAKQRTEYSQWRSMYLFDPKSKRIGSPAPSPPFAPTQEPQISRLQEESSSNEDKDEDEGFYLVTNKGTNESSEGSHKGTKGSGKKDVEEEEEEEERLSADELACAEHAELQKEINEDVVRTYSDHEFFARQDTRDIMNRVLMVYSRRHTALSYVQGMNEILAPLLYALDRDYAQVHALTAEESSVDLDTLSYKPAADLTPEDVRAVISEVVRIDYLEHDVYWLFTCLMRVIGPWFNSPKHPILAPAHSSKHADSNSRSANTASPTSVLPDEAATTSSCSANTNSISSNSSSASSSNCKEIEVVVKCREIQGLLAAKDPELEQALQALGIQPQLYMLRWVRILFSQVFGLDDLLRVWDAVFACGAPFRLVDHLCVTLLTLIRKSVIGRSYSDAMCALFHYPLALFPPPMITAIALGSMRSGALPYYHEAYLPPPPPGSLKLPDLIVNAAELGDPALSMSPGRTPGVRGVVRRRGTGSSSSSSSNNTSEKGNTRDKSAGPGNGEGKQHSWEGLQSKKETLQNFFGGFLKKAPKQQQQQQQQQPNCDPRRPPTQEQLDEATMEIVSLRYEKLHHTSVCNQVAGKLDKLSLLLEVLREKVADDEEGRSVVQQAECEVEDIRRTLTAQTPQQFAPFLPEVSLPQVTTRSSVYPSPPSPTLAQPLEQQQ